MIEYGTPSAPVGQVAGLLADAAHLLLVEVAGRRRRREAQGHRGRDDHEKEEALQSHRRAKVADLSDEARGC